MIDPGAERTNGDAVLPPPVAVDGSGRACSAVALYVDDEPLLLEVAKSFLEMKTDIAVDICTSAQEALGMLSRKEYDVVVSDYQMPSMDGLMFLKELRRQGNGIPFVLFTGKGREEVAMEALNNGADFYLQKGGAPASQFGELHHIIIQLARKRRTERTLWEKNERLSLINENIQGVISQLDNDGKFQHVSPSVYILSGYRPEDLIGRSAFELIHPDDIPTVRESIARSRRERGAIRLDYRYAHADGHYMRLETTGSYFYDMAGNIEGSLLISRDVSTQHRALEALEESERRYRELVESTNTIVLEMDREARIVYMNRHALEFFGYSREEVVGKNVLGTITPLVDEDGRDLRELVDRIVREPDAFNPDVNENMKKDGSKVWLMWTCKAGSNESGTSDLIHCVAVDVTERYLADREMKRSWSMLQATFDSILDAILVIDLRGRVLAHNGKFLDMWRVGAEDIPIGSAFPHPGRLMHRLEDPGLFSAKLTRIPLDDGADSADETFRFKDGRVCRMSSSPQMMDGKMIGRVWSFHDMTDVTRTKKALGEATAYLQGIYENSVMGIAAINHTTDRFVMANPAYLRFVGYSLEELTQMGLKDITHPADYIKAKQRFKSLVEGKTPNYTEEKRYIRKDGTVAWGRVTVSMVNDSSLGGVYTIGMLEDIYHQQRIEEQLEKSEEQFSTLADNIPNGAVFLVDHDLRYLKVGGKGLESVGLDSSLEGKTIYEAFPGMAENYLVDRYRRVLAGESIVQETPFKGRTFMAVYFPLRDATGKIYSAMSLLQDITELKMTEMRLRKLNRSLKMLSECNQILLHVESEDELYTDICRVLASIGGYKLAWVGLADQGDDDIIHPVASAGEARGFTDGLTASFKAGPLGSGPAGMALRAGKVCRMADLHSDERYHAWRDRAVEWGLRSEIAFPLVYREKTIGVLAIYSDNVDAFGDEDEALLGELVADLSFGIVSLRYGDQHRRSEEDLSRKGRQLELLVSATRNLNAMIDTEALQDAMVSSAIELTGCEMGMAGFMQDDRMIYRTIIKGGEKHPLDLAFGKDDGVTGWLIKTHQPRWSNDPRNDPVVRKDIMEQIGSYYNYVSAPIENNQGVLLGCFWLMNKPGGGFDMQDVNALTGLASGAAVALENASMVKALKAREVALDQANKKLNLISRITRHDLLNQMTSLTGYLEIAKMRNSDQNIGNYIDKAMRSAENIHRHITFSRDYQEMGTNKPSWVSVKGAVQKGASTLHLGELKMTVEVDGLEVMADRMLEKVFHNLLDDSIRHGGKATRAMISCHEGADGLVIVYEDDGGGIPTERKVALFDLTVHSHGMHMAREILAITGIGITEVGAPGQGVRFEMVVPKGSYRFPS